MLAACGSGGSDTPAMTNSRPAAQAGIRPQQAPPEGSERSPATAQPARRLCGRPARAAERRPCEDFPSRVYVPNSESNTVNVIDPSTFKVIDDFPVGALPQHVVPSYDLKTLWVNNDEGNSLTPIDPATGKPGKPVPVDDPTTSTSPPTGATRSSWPSGCAGSTSATRTRCAAPLALACPARASTTWTSPPTAATCWPAASSAAADQGRRRPRAGRRHARAASRRACPRTSSSRRTGGSSTSPT